MMSECTTATPIRQVFFLCSCVMWIVVAGCTMEQATRVAPDVPARFENDAASPPEKWPAQDWYRQFSSVELNALIDEAARHNEDLAGARARVRQADARARQAGAAILPSLDAAGNANYLAGHSSQGGGHELDWSAMLSASYEVDFWGKNRAAANSALLLADAARADRDTVALTTLAGVAGGYFRIMALQERRTIARSNRDAAREVLAVVQARFDAGAAGPVELAAQKSAMDTAEVAITDLEQQQGEALAALALPATVLTIPGIGPSFALGGSLLQPIFDHGRLRARRDEAVAKELELLTVYRSAIVAAFGDVENALRAAQQSRRAMQFELDNAAQSERAFTGAKLRYESGSGDFLTLLEVQQTLYAARDRVVQAKLARLQSLVGVCKALGGGWTEPPAAAMNR